MASVLVGIKLCKQAIQRLDTVKSASAVFLLLGGTAVSRPGMILLTKVTVISCGRVCQNSKGWPRHQSAIIRPEANFVV